MGNSTRSNVLSACLSICVLTATALGPAIARSSPSSADIDKKVQKFLNENRSQWSDWNVPYEDGKLLHDLIVRNNYTRALEIGTSTGHSAIWMAWALSKTGGRLITIEIDEDRYKTALENFREAGVEGLIDARLADAHKLVKELPGPFDFVFSDADKEWYTRYFREVDPKLVKGGCFTAHNVNHAYGDIKRFLDYVRSLPNYRTTIDRSSSAGISISYKQ
ncbi:MAG: methyltransferase [Deltaproteobacteria bacterium HGW-Deltaproteobacteria-21]|nr:MAG: methyltransferase [Deltaproteobacteria bacterium HGW-Deltaproteobacteria-21]